MRAETTSAPVPQDNMPPGDYLLSVSQVSAKTSLSRSSIYRMVAKGLFPKPRQVSESRVAWLLSDVEPWIAGRPEAEHPDAA